MSHRHEHGSCSCGCGGEHSHHREEESCSCGCGGEHAHHHEEESCSCGCGHSGHTHGVDVSRIGECGCGCGHDHGHEHHHGGGKGELFFLAAVAVLLGLALGFAPATGWLRLGLFLVPYLLAGHRVLREAGENILRGRVFDENFLMAIASVGAFAVGEYPEAVLVMLLYRIGEYCEGLAVERSRRSIAALLDIAPDTATVERDGQEQCLAPEEVRVGEVILVRPGERVPLDGIVLSGAAALDTAALTGESVPREAAEGDAVLSGCIDLNGLLRIRVTRPYGESAVARILTLVEEARDKKSRSENFITRFARVYTPAVVAAAAALAVIPPLFGGGWADWFHRALTFLVISCPCALVISVPLTFFGGLGGASRRGILIKGSCYLETLARAETVAFDKTGTLTRGELTVGAVHPAGGEGQALLALAAAAERYSDHPAARALRAACPEAGQAAVTEVREQPGQGLSARVNGTAVHVGSARLMEALGLTVPVCQEPGTVVHVAADGAYAGYILLTDRAKPTAAGAVAALKALGVKRCVMLSGDRKSAAEQLAAELGLDEALAELSPEGKVEAMDGLRRQLSGGTLLYVGDGINDAPVLSGADAGIAMGAFGTDAAVEAADVVLMDDDPAQVALAIRIGRKTLAIARQNIALALGIKAAVMVIGVLGLAPLWLAVLADVGVCLLCIFHALRALHVK